MVNKLYIYLQNVKSVVLREVRWKVFSKAAFLYRHKSGKRMLRFLKDVSMNVYKL